VSKEGKLEKQLWKDETDKYKAKAGYVKGKYKIETSKKKQSFGAEAGVDVLKGDDDKQIYAKREVSAKRTAYGESSKIKGEVGVAIAREEIFPISQDKENPLLRVGAKGDVLNASAETDVLIGNDGRRIGVGEKVSAGAKVAGGGLEAEINIPIPFTDDKTFRLKIGVEGDAGSVGVGVGEHAYYDEVDKRGYFDASGSLKALGGLGINLEMSVGKKRMKK
jgi:hypothetical protein